MKNIIIVSIVAQVLAIAFGSPLVPEPQSGQGWMDHHRRNVAYTIASNGSIPIIFYGGSITDFWDSDGKEVWDEKYVPLGATNYGISGDRIENILWRILNGEVQGLSPKLIVTQLGGNNISVRDSDEDILEGIVNLVRILRQLLPSTKILLLGVPPRREIGEHDTWEVVANINILMAKLDNGDSVRYLNMMDQLSIAWREVDPQLYKDDKLHFVLEGYKVWDKTMSPLFHQMLQ